MAPSRGLLVKDHNDAWSPGVSKNCRMINLARRPGVDNVEIGIASAVNRTAL
jgi:hypothetical protein